MLIYGALLKCVDPMLTLAAALTYERPIFVCPREKRDEANAAKRKIYAPCQNAKSDHMAVLSAVQIFQESNLRSHLSCADRSFSVTCCCVGGSARAVAFCRERFLAPEALFSILDGRVEIARILADVGFVSSAYAQRIARGISEGDSHFDAFATNSRFVRAALCAGFYPNLIRVKHPPKK